MMSKASAPAWLYYVGVSDIDASLGRAKSLGATLHHGPHQVPGGVCAAQLTDPDGVAFAMVGPKN